MTQKSKNNTVTIGGIATQLLKAGKSAEETLAAVLRVFPEAQTTKKCIYFYASQAGIQLRRAAVVDEKALKALMQELNPKVVEKAS